MHGSPIISSVTDSIIRLLKIIFLSVIITMLQWMPPDSKPYLSLLPFQGSSAYAAEAVAKKGDIVKTSSKTNLFSQPSGGGKWLRKIKKGEKGKVLQVKGKWLRIHFKDGSKGWVNTKKVEIATSEHKGVLKARTSLRTSPSKKGRRIRKLEKGEECLIVGKTKRNKWFKLRFDDGETGWAPARLIKIEKREPVAEPEISPIEKRIGALKKNYRIRRKPSMKAKKIRMVEKGTEAEIVGESGNNRWLKLSFDGDIEGWAPKSLVEIREDKSPGDGAVVLGAATPSTSSTNGKDDAAGEPEKGDEDGGKDKEGSYVFIGQMHIDKPDSKSDMPKKEEKKKSEGPSLAERLLNAPKPKPIPKDPDTVKPPPNISYYKIAAYSTFFSGLALVGVGGIGTWQTDEARKEYNKQVDTGYEGDYIRKQHENWKYASISCYAIGGSLVVTGILLWIFDPGVPENAGHASFGLMPDNHGFTASLVKTW